MSVPSEPLCGAEDANRHFSSCQSAFICPSTLLPSVTRNLEPRTPPHPPTPRLWRTGPRSSPFICGSTLLPSVTRNLEPRTPPHPCSSVFICGSISSSSPHPHPEPETWNPVSSAVPLFSLSSLSRASRVSRAMLFSGFLHLPLPVRHPEPGTWNPEPRFIRGSTLFPSVTRNPKPGTPFHLRFQLSSLSSLSRASRVSRAMLFSCFLHLRPCAD